jgi:acyl-CoA reductase-like NAD-dependent aldehyde dehydrogenase
MATQTEVETGHAYATDRKEDFRRPANGFPVDAAKEVATARAAQPQWAATPLPQRLAIIRRARRLIPDWAARIAAPIHAGRRQPGESLGAEILPLADSLRFLEQYAPRVLRPRRYGARSQPLWLFGVRSEVHREPHGVVLVIGPSNYPLFLTASQATQALAAGNAVVIKPGEGGGQANRLFADMLIAAGLDPNLIRVLGEEADAAPRAIEAGVDKVLLTGSARTGQKLLAQLAPRLVPATLELSGTDAAFVRHDANLDLVTRALRFAIRLNHSETCIAPRRVFVDRRVAGDLQQRLAVMVRDVPAYEARTPAGKAAASLVADAVGKGARLVAGQVLPDQEGVTPCVVAGATTEMPLLREEVFAPVLTLVPVENDEQALEAASKCPYALGATVFSNEEDARRLAPRINAGVVVINDVIAPTADPRLPFGGRDRSGYGSTRGVEGLLDVTRVKVVTLRRGNMHVHLEQPMAGDDEFFEAYIRASNTGSWTQWLASWFKVLRLLRKRLKTQPVAAK